MSDSQLSEPKRKGRSLFAEALGLDEDAPLWGRPLPAKGPDGRYNHVPGPLHSSFDPDLTIGRFLKGIVENNPDSDKPLFPGLRMLGGVQEYSDQFLMTYGPGTMVDGDLLPEKSTMTFKELSEREKTLERESVEAELADGKVPHPELCRKCRRHDLDQLDDREGKREVTLGLFGGYAEILLRQHCSIHRHILRIITHNTGGGRERKLYPRLESVDQEIQGTQLDVKSLKSGERYIAVRFGLKWVGAIRKLDTTNWPWILRQSYEFSKSGSAALKNPCLTGTQEVSYGLIKCWLEDCDSSHGPKCNPAVVTPNLIPPVKLMLMDVVDERLVNGSSDMKYFALSYVWGKVSMYETLQANKAARSVRGSLGLSNQQIPQTVRDAMAFVQKLGERYLWVDAFCIIQDDAESKHEDIRHMDQIYSQAYATIVALTGVDANSGLPGIRPGSRHRQEYERVGESAIFTTPPMLPYVLDISPWMTRGWTFQEKLLSRRCIYFSDEYVYFQCGTIVSSEAGVDLPAEWEENSTGDFSSLVDLIPNAPSWNFEAYSNLVMRYTERKLTFPGDILNAFSGSLAVIEKHFRCKMLSGLPAAALDLALLWFSAEPLYRREVIEKDGNSKQVFPSWSWAGWEGPVVYTIDLVRIRDKIGHPTPKVDAFEIFHNGILYTAHKRGSTGYECLETTKEGISGPDLGPEVLHFWAHTIDAARFRIDNRQVTYLTGSHGEAVGKQGVFGIQTMEGIHCGLMYLEKQTTPLIDGPIEFVLISEYGDTDKRRRGPSSAEGPVHYFNEKYFPWRGDNSGIVNLLLVQWDNEVAQRMAVAQLHIQAWMAAMPELKHVRLG